MMERTKREDEEGILYGVGCRIWYTIAIYEIENIDNPKILTHRKNMCTFWEIVFVGTCEKDIVDKLIKNHEENNEGMDIRYIDLTTRPKYSVSIYYVTEVGLM